MPGRTASASAWRCALLLPPRSTHSGPRRSAPQQQATPSCSPSRPPSHPPAVLSPSDPALRPCPPFRGPRATVRCLSTAAVTERSRACARCRGASLPQGTPSRTFSGDPAGQRVRGGDCRRPSRPGQAQGLGVCTGAGRRGDTSEGPRPSSPQPPGPATSGSGGRHSLTSGGTATNSAIPSLPFPRPHSRRRRLPRPFAVARELESACAAEGRSPSVSGPEEGRLQRARRLKTAALGQAMLHRALPRGRSAPAPRLSPARPAFLPPSLPPPPPPGRRAAK